MKDTLKLPKGINFEYICYMKELDKNMYFRAKPEVMELATFLRNNMTYHEKLLWEKLKGKQICGIRFRRQHPIDFFIADFYCHEAMLVIEVDGEIHNDKADYDDSRTAVMEKYGIKVIRFTNFDIENRITDVIITIQTIVNKRIKSLP
jgi:very-short-patch-repair endonuclease